MKSKMKKVRLSISISSNSNQKLGLVLFLSTLFLLIGLYSKPSYALAIAKIRDNPTKVYDIKANLKLIDKDELVDTLRSFVKASRPSRLVGSSGHEAAQKFLHQKLEETNKNKDSLIYIDTFNPDVDYAKKMYWDDFNRQIKTAYKPSDPEYKKWLEYTKHTTSFLEERKSFKGKNIIWEKRGHTRPKDILVIGAHYDTLVQDPATLLIKDEASMPGANDNGSGVIIALSLVKLLSQMKLPMTVRVVFFDWGELGFLGSRAFVNKYKNEFTDKNFLGLINLDRLGYDSKFLDKEKKYGNMKMYLRRKGSEGHIHDKRLAQKISDLGDNISPSIHFEIVGNQFKNSDNVSFWNEDLVALTMTGDWENDFDPKRYHTSDDFVETLNINTFYRAFQFIGGAVMSMAFGISR